MRTTLKTIILLAVFVVIFQNVIFSDNFLTPESAAELALKNNPDILAAEMILNSVKNRAITEGTPANPSVEFSFNTDIKSVRTDSVGVYQSFDQIFVLQSKGRIASNNIKITQEYLREIRAETVCSVKNTMAEIELAIWDMNLAGENLNLLRAVSVEAQMQYKSGLMAKSDLFRSKIAMREAEVELYEKELMVKQKKAMLNMLLGRPINTEFEVKDDDTYTADQVVIQFLDDMISIRPDVQMSLALLDSAKENETIEQLRRMPYITTGIEFSSVPNTDNYKATLGLNIPLWNLNHGEAERARYERKAQEILAEKAVKTAELDIFNALNEIKIAEKKHEISSFSLQEANELLLAAKTAYKSGKMAFVVYLGQVKAAYEAKLRYFVSRYEWRLALNRLEKITYRSAVKGEKE